MKEKKYLKLSDYASQRGVTYRTAWNHYKNGLIPTAFKEESTGSVYIPIDEPKQKKAVCYARVSSNDRKNSLLEQKNRLEEFVAASDMKLVKSYKEIASGMNDNRKKLNEILSSDNWNVLVVENKDRLTRFGFNYLKTTLEQQGKEIVVLHETEDDKEDLMKDLVSIIYSFSARMYGLRRKKNKEEIIKFIES